MVIHRPSDPLTCCAGMPIVYRIVVQGELEAAWFDWFVGMELSSDQSCSTVLTDPVSDQAALHGLLAKFRDLVIPLISVNRVDY